MITDGNVAHSDASAGIACRLTAVIRLGMDDDGASDDCVQPGDAEIFKHSAIVRSAATVCLKHP